jgi:HEAT repeat protein
MHRLAGYLCAVILVLTVPATAGSQRLPDDPQAGGLDAWIDAIRSGSEIDWARALEGFARIGSGGADAVPALDSLLRDTHPAVRARAAAALGAIGPAARPAVDPLTEALEDPDPQVRAEAAFALGMILDRSDAVLSTLFRAVMDTVPAVRRRAAYAVNRLRHRGRTPLHAELREQVRAALRAPSARTRDAAASFLSGLSDEPWQIEEYIRLLNDPEADVRETAAYALAGLGSAAAPAVTALRELSRDSIEWVREAAEEAIAAIQTGDAASPPLPSCSHRLVDGLIPMQIEIEPGPWSLRGDGLGAYRQGSDGVQVSQSYALNLLLPFAQNQSVPTISASEGAAARVRRLEFDLPPGATRQVRTVADSAARLHVFYLIDSNGVVWNFRDIPVGSEVGSDRTELWFGSEGRSLLLQFGPWGIGHCNEDYAQGGRVHGEGTSRVRIRRLGEDEYRIQAPEGSLGRLWDYTDPSHPVDLGLHAFDFALQTTRSR